MSETHPHAQSKYQVRFDWGTAGAAVVAAGADVVVWVNVLGEADDRPDCGIEEPEEQHALGTEVRGEHYASGIEVSEKRDPLILAAGLTDASAVAERVLEEQVALGRRAFIAVIAAGAPRDGGLRFCVEDLLGAGAVIDALAAVGIDYCSPEAAAACAAFTGLRGAVTHLTTASASARELIAAGTPAADIRAAAVLGSSTTVRMVRMLRSLDV